MKFIAFTCVLATTIASAIAQTIELGYPTDGAILPIGKDFTVQVVRPASPQQFYEMGIALTVAHCDNGVCPQPDQYLGDVLYSGPYTPTGHPDGYYQNFTVQIGSYMPEGPAVFTLVHAGLLGGGPIPLLEFRNASVTLV